eukprot:CAMPEP_0179000222 /NCGR_PEP_ID=MMETSP0795-20121207/10535_1 /TAXON_ID=88552 /ORGANISM="Amoebophrya sp., Strain Ameob2" /LENGTH=1150 /DNA_ID=CAMNT_0020693161 /DNA_START=80 /DNA_END=3532 /DNA_ORIENTATION=+
MVEQQSHMFGSASITLYPPAGFHPPDFQPLHPPKLVRCCSFNPKVPCVALPFKNEPKEIAFASGNLLVIQNAEDHEHAEQDVGANSNCSSYAHASQRFFRGRSEILCIGFSREETEKQLPEALKSRPGTGRAAVKFGAFGEKAVVSTTSKGGSSLEGDIVLFDPIRGGGRADSSSFVASRPTRRLKFHKCDVVQLKFLSSTLLISFGNDKQMTGALWALSGAGANKSTKPIKVFPQGVCDLVKQIVLLPDNHEFLVNKSSNTVSFFSYGKQHLKFWEVGRLDKSVKAKRGSFLQGYSPKFVTAGCWFGDPSKPVVAAGTGKGEVFFLHDGGNSNAVRVIPATASKFGRTHVLDQYRDSESPIVSLTCQTIKSAFGAYSEQHLVALTESGSVLVFHVIVSKPSAKAKNANVASLNSRPTTSSMLNVGAVTGGGGGTSAAAHPFPKMAATASRPSTSATYLAKRGLVTASSKQTLNGYDLDDCFYTYGKQLAITNVKVINLWSSGLEKAGPVAPLVAAIPGAGADSLIVTSSSSIFSSPFPKGAGTQNVLSLEQSDFGDQASSVMSQTDINLHRALITQPGNRQFTCATSFDDLVFIGAADGVSCFRVVNGDHLAFEISLLPGVPITALAASEFGLAIAGGNGRLLFFKNYNYKQPAFDRVITTNGSKITCIAFAAATAATTGTTSLAFGNADGCVFYLDLSQNPPRPKILRGHASAIQAVSFLQPGNVLLSASVGGQLLAFDPVMTRRLASLAEVKELSPEAASKMPYGWFVKGAWEPGKKYFPDRKFLAQASSSLLVASNGREFEVLPYPCVEPVMEVDEEGVTIGKYSNSVLVHGTPIVDVCGVKSSSCGEEGVGGTNSGPGFLTVSRDSVVMWEAHPPHASGHAYLSPELEAAYATKLPQRAIAQENALLRAEEVEREQFSGTVGEKNRLLEDQMADLQSHMDSMVGGGGGAAGDVDHMEIEGFPPPEEAISLPCFKPQVRVGGPAARRAAANVGIDAADPNLMGRREKIMKSAKAKDTLCQKVGAGSGFNPHVCDPMSTAGMLCADKASADFRLRTVAKKSFLAVEVGARCPIIAATKLEGKIRFTSATRDEADVEIPPGYDITHCVIPEAEFGEGKCHFAVPLRTALAAGEDAKLFSVLPLGHARV